MESPVLKPTVYLPPRCSLRDWQYQAPAYLLDDEGADVYGKEEAKAVSVCRYGLILALCD